MRSAAFSFAAVSFAGLVVVATTGCVWMLFDRERPLPPCDLRMVDMPSLYRPPDDVIWGWLERYHRGDQVYVLYNGNQEKVADGLRQYKRSNPGATSVDYFTSLGMSCKAGGATELCVRELTARYVCTLKQPPSEADGKLPQYEGIVGIAIRFDENGQPRASAGIKGKGGPLWPPYRPPVR